MSRSADLSPDGSREEAGREPVLAVRGLDVAYDRVQVLFSVDLHVAPGEIVAVLGTNGAGKSTLLRAIAGLVRPRAGTVALDGVDVAGRPPASIAALGLSLVPGERSIFPTLTVAENLRLAAWLGHGRADEVATATEEVLADFPVLRARRDLAAGSLSGGEQQMLSLGQAFLGRPKLLMIDELSLGLAPTVVEHLVGVVAGIRARGTAVVLVEQSVSTALRVADRAVFVEKGEVRFSGPASDLVSREDLLRSMFLHAPEPVPAAPAPAGGEPGRVVLDLQGVVKRYGGIRAVDDVSLQLHEGEVLGLIGPNGAGKTTLLDLISGFQATDGGRITLGRREITSMRPFARARGGLGRSFQSARSWPSLTVREAVLSSLERHVRAGAALPAFLGLPSVRHDEARLDRAVERTLRALGLWSYRDTYVGDVSTGVRRLVELGGLLAWGPKVILLDEPSSGIAQSETEALGAILLQMRELLDASILVIEHDMTLLSSVADRMVALVSGAKVAEGTPDEVLADQQVVESYLGGAVTA
ncbi:MAG TPA: ATP-binding cassette domain-containing protein [Acidimicrobiales bacterium]|nr:ATP-binding cassette domain-containing protein [Acidimicrobiales bacterium]